MSMLGFVYLILILGWILIVLFLKCKKSITSNIGLSDTYEDTIGSNRHSPSIHVIQLQNNDLENEDRLLNAYRNRSGRLRSHSQLRSLTAINEHNLATVCTPDAMINPAYIPDEEYIMNAAPPSYDEVMRQPEIYPKVCNKITEENT